MIRGDWLSQIEATRPLISRAALGIGMGAALVVWIGAMFQTGTAELDRSAAYIIVIALSVWIVAHHRRH